MKSAGIFRAFFAAMVAIAIHWTALAAPSSDTVADQVFINGKIYTVNHSQPWAEAVAIKDGKFVYVGDNAGAERWINAETEQTDLAGKFVLPGLIDSHLHLGLTALWDAFLVMPFSGQSDIPYTNPDDAAMWLSAYVDEHPDAPGIVGGFWRKSDFGPAGPHKKDLDAIVSDRPVMLMEQWAHSWWLNSKALEMLGATRETPDPVPNLSFYGRDQNGEPTGLIKEWASYPLLEKLLRPNNALESNLLRVIDYLSATGVTSLFDAGVFHYHDEIFSVLAKLEREGRLPMRIEESYHVFLPDHFDNAISELKRLREAYGGEKLTINTVKIHLDGINMTGTAAMLDPYHDEATNRGTTVVDENVLAQFMRKLHQEKIDLHIHVWGDGATRVALNAYEKLSNEIGAQPASRLTLCHLAVVKDEDLARFKPLGVIASFTPHWHGFNRDLFLEPTLGERSNAVWRAQPLFDAGATVTFSSDLYLLAALDRANPYVGIQVGHNRQDLAGGKDAALLPPESERLDLENLIAGYTLNGAYQLRSDNRLGSIEVGKSADLVVLDDNLFEMDRYEIHKVNALLTLMDGKEVFRRK
jgi:predicted amidohydrolase YtcJ